MSDFKRSKNALVTKYDKDSYAVWDGEGIQPGIGHEYNITQRSEERKRKTAAAESDKKKLVKSIAKPAQDHPCVAMDDFINENTMYHDDSFLTEHAEIRKQRETEVDGDKEEKTINDNNHVNEKPKKKKITRNVGKDKPQKKRFNSKTCKKCMLDCSYAAQIRGDISDKPFAYSRGNCPKR